MRASLVKGSTGWWWWWWWVASDCCLRQSQIYLKARWQLQMTTREWSPLAGLSTYADMQSKHRQRVSEGSVADGGAGPEDTGWNGHREGEDKEGSWCREIGSSLFSSFLVSTQATNQQQKQWRRQLTRELCRTVPLEFTSFWFGEVKLANLVKSETGFCAQMYQSQENEFQSGLKNAFSNETIYFDSKHSCTFDNAFEINF